MYALVSRQQSSKAARIRAVKCGAVRVAGAGKRVEVNREVEK